MTIGYCYNVQQVARLSDIEPQIHHKSLLIGSIPNLLQQSEMSWLWRSDSYSRLQGLRLCTSSTAVVSSSVC